MSSSNNIAAKILFFVGEALIFFGFWEFFHDKLPENVFYLDFIVVSVVYTLYAIRFFDLFRSAKSFDQIVAGLGLNWVILTFYSVVALLIIYYGATSLLSFKFQLLLQLGAAFLMAVGFNLLSKVYEKANNVAEMQAELKVQKDRIDDSLKRLELEARVGSPVLSDELKLIEKLKEQNRFISPVNNAESLRIDEELLRLIAEVQRTVSFDRENRSAILDNLQKCVILLEHKKQFSIN
ncbi:MAG: hypothetical protein LC102_05340 [Ignavibacteriales bacterium]|nr:MAG: hypothetical protein F9K26_06765 [Ignavibacteriaceae bacterium]MBW7873190.1 hypothetical protein [Ignavibacteria bacterium]MCZ2142832.1 hypothetical protein [Ignavibacteriales bacterium]OQY75219.1 MAG: hypothetical protein B6D45_05940 [Ignavibacteriales bacterium UTCHB3]MBV6443926.1 hypothetical protein [Ignavibacteriaceae bacterium]